MSDSRLEPCSHVWQEEWSSVIQGNHLRCKGCRRTTTLPSWAELASTSGEVTE